MKKKARELVIMLTIFNIVFILFVYFIQFISSFNKISNQVSHFLKKSIFVVM